MKKQLFFLICLLLSASFTFADEAKLPSVSQGSSNAPEKRSNGTVPGSPEKRMRSAPVTQKDLPPRVNQNITQGQPGGLQESVTPENIKAFLSRPGAKPVKENYIILNFDNADLRDVINTVGSITNENFIISPGMDARITIHSAKKIPVSEVMNVFESVLEINGLALVRSGSFFKVVPGTAAKQKPLEVNKSDEAGMLNDVDRPVTQIISVNYVPVTEVSAVLTPMLSPSGSIIPNPRNSLLIVNDLSSNIIRLLKILREIDVNAFKNTRMSFFKPRYSDVQSLSNELDEVLGALNLSKEGVALVPIERINSLIVFSASRTLLNTITGWLRKLDEEVIAGQNVFVYQVQNVKAESIAEILRALYEGTGSTKTQARKKQTNIKKTARLRTAISSVKQNSSGGRVEIITFEPTNSLVILASPGIYREMVDTIKKMDMYPREVLIEAVIAEVDISDSQKYGIQWSVLHTVTSSSGDFTGLAQGSSGLENFPSLPTAAPGLASAADGGFSYVLFKADKLSAMLSALASESKVDILSSPRLLVRDQEEASIEVGSDVPTATSTTSTTTTETLTQNIEYRTVGIKLKIKPTISEEKTVVLDIEQEVSSKGDNQQVGQKGNTFPTFSTTKTKTSIVVPDKQGIVIGGIMEETKGKSWQGIPLLSKIPILGYLFRYSVDTTSKKELIIIVTPRVVTDRTDAEKLTAEYMNKLKNVKEFLIKKGSQVDVPGLNDAGSSELNGS